MNAEVLQKYLAHFGSVSRNYNRAGEGAPHKPLLLLALLDEVQKGTYPLNHIPVTPELVASFRAYWRVLVPADAPWKNRMVYPFRYLGRDKFWDLTRDGAPVNTAELGEFTSLNKLNEAVDGGASRRTSGNCCTTRSPSTPCALTCCKRISRRHPPSSRLLCPPIRWIMRWRN